MRAKGAAEGHTPRDDHGTLGDLCTATIENLLAMRNVTPPLKMTADDADEHSPASGRNQKRK